MKIIHILGLAVALAGLTGCPPAEEIEKQADRQARATQAHLQLEADNRLLWLTAVDELRRAGVTVEEDDDLPSLNLSESVEVSVASLDTDGSAKTHRINYTLQFQMNGDAPERISFSRIIDSDKNAHRADLSRQSGAAEDLRRSALANLIYLLGFVNP